MLQGEHSAILLACIKELFVLKTNFCHFESGHFTFKNRQDKDLNDKW